MRRIVTVAFLAAALSSCDPTGNIPPSANTSNIRFSNLVVDAPAIDVFGSGVAQVHDLPFGELSDIVAVNSVASSLETRRSSDDLVLGSTDVGLVGDVNYTFYAIGKITDFQGLLAPDDTASFVNDSFAVRFVHAIGSRAGNGLDLYLTGASTDITALSPLISNTTYGQAKSYVLADTSVRRLRLTVTGQKTPILDTTFAAAFSDSTSLSFVGSEKSGGGEPIRLMTVIDRAP